MNDKLVELCFAARLLFIGLWTLADCEGYLEDRPKRIKMSLFPADQLDVDALLGDLATAGFIHRYKVQGVRYIHVVNFSKHQNPHHKEALSVIPKPISQDEDVGISVVDEASSGAIMPMSKDMDSAMDKSNMSLRGRLDMTEDNLSHAPVLPRANLGHASVLPQTDPADSLIPDSLNLIPDSLIPDPFNWIPDSLNDGWTSQAVPSEIQDDAYAESDQEVFLIEGHAQDSWLACSNATGAGTERCGMLTVDDPVHVSQAHASHVGIDQPKATQTATPEAGDHALNIPFETFWDLYDKKVQPKACVRKWQRLTDAEREQIMQHVQQYKLAQPDNKEVLAKAVEEADAAHLKFPLSRASPINTARRF